MNLNFSTKKHWKYSTKIEYLEKGLEKFINNYKEKGIELIAFPLLGADKGGLNKENSIKIMQKYLNKVDIPAEIWYFDPTAKDDLYDDFKSKFLNLDENIIKEKTNLRINAIKKIKKIFLEKNDINSFSGLSRVKGIGDITLEKSLNFVRNYKNNLILFDFVN